MRTENLKSDRSRAPLLILLDTTFLAFFKDSNTMLFYSQKDESSLPSFLLFCNYYITLCSFFSFFYLKKKST